jgi:hypothetical protein
MRQGQAALPLLQPHLIHVLCCLPERRRSASRQQSILLGPLRTYISSFRRGGQVPFSSVKIFPCNSCFTVYSTTLTSSLLFTTNIKRMVLNPASRRDSSTEFPDDAVRRIIAYPFPTEHKYWSTDRDFHVFGTRGKPLTVCERQMMAFHASITDKPDWQRKLQDESTRAKWRDEFEGQPHTAHEGDAQFVIPVEAFDYVSVYNRTSYRRLS